jgi:hypothetical protein
MQNSEARKRHEEEDVERAKNSVLRTTIQELWDIKDSDVVRFDKEMVHSIDSALMKLWYMLPEEERDNFINN